MLGTLLLSTGAPMLLGGDELWRTQGGNNNAYCLDDPTSWVDWSAPEATGLTAFVARLSEIRRSSVTLHRDRFYRDGDVTWWHFSGRPMGTADWHDHGARSLGLLVGEWLLLLHAGDAGPCTLPPGGPYVPTVDSTCPDGTPASARPVPGGCTVTVPEGSLLLLRRDVPPAR
jgi:glycogen operon protein